MNINKFPEIAFGTQNIRSFNVTGHNDQTFKKIQCILKGKEDIIFLSNLRLNSINQISMVENITKKLLFYGYEFYHNSKNANRGAGILIASKLGVKIMGTEMDDGGNFLLLKIELKGHTITVGCVYGPNINENIGVYEDLLEKLTIMQNNTIILGGDWNCTWDTRGVDLNIDCLNMAAIPSKRRSEKLKNLSAHFKLTEPYRAIHPNRREYTYIPAVRENTNRSRLDFFLISDHLLSSVGDC